MKPIAQLSWKYSVLAFAKHWLTPSTDETMPFSQRRAAFHRATRPGYILGYPIVMEHTDTIIAGVPVRRYTPPGALPGTLVYFHGGGFALGDLDSHDTVVRALANATQREAISVHYRLAPEHPYPAAVDDCLAVTKAVVSLCESGGSGVVVCGDSAGGTLAAVVANACTAAGVRLSAQVLVYPATDSTTERPSFEEFKDVSFLTRDKARWYKGLYTPDPTVRSEPACSPLLAPSLAGVPPAFILLARCDVLHDDGVAYHAKLSAAGVEATLDVVEGAPHAFFSLLGLAEAQGAVARIAEWLQGRWPAPPRGTMAHPSRLSRQPE
jgi:acetyl esterase